MRKKILYFSLFLFSFWFFFDVLLYRLMYTERPVYILDENNNKVYVTE